MRHAWLVLMLLLACAHAPAAEDPGRAAQIEAALVFNVLKFVEFPQRSGDLTLCLLSASHAVNRVLEQQQGRALRDGALQVRRVDESLAGIEECWAVYFSPDDAAVSAAVLPRLRDRPVLTIGDLDGFAESGGVVGIYAEQDRLRLKINTDSARRANLSIAAQMLSLARIIREDSP